MGMCLRGHVAASDGMGMCLRGHVSARAWAPSGACGVTDGACSSGRLVGVGRINYSPVPRGRMRVVVAVACHGTVLVMHAAWIVSA